MKLQETLTKENFWNGMMVTYPKSMKIFCEWIDKYKTKIEWSNMFAANYKFHDIPYEMQQGIWIEFANEITNKLFEQPEYSYYLDLEEDIKKVFGEIEELIDIEQEN